VSSIEVRLSVKQSERKERKAPDNNQVASQFALRHDERKVPESTLPLNRWNLVVDYTRKSNRAADFHMDLC
jgi:hypothetical protein